MGVSEEKVIQKGADPRKETRITKPRNPMKNFVERFFQPVMEYLFTRDQSYSIVILQPTERVKVFTFLQLSAGLVGCQGIRKCKIRECRV